MMQLRARELRRLPNVLTLARLPLAVAFPLVSGSPALAFGVLCAAGATDVLDGYLARRQHTDGSLGAMLDPIADKVFAASVLATLVSSGQLPIWSVPLLLAREMVEAPLLLLLVLGRGRRPGDCVETRANVLGKIATVLQFAAVGCALMFPRGLSAVLLAAGAAGLAAGLSYCVRELRIPGDPSVGPGSVPRST